MTEFKKVKQWVPHKLDKTVQRRLQKLAAATDIQRIAVMPDVHLAGDVCNGVVLASKSRIYPQCVGGDIGCGYLSVELDQAESDPMLDARTLDAIWRASRQSVPLNKHVDRSEFVTEIELSAEKLQKSARREGRLQLGTLGRGNHFIELQTDQAGKLAILIHSGSRSMGQKISAWHLDAALLDPDSGLKYLDASSDSAERFLNDLRWARQYARANRLEILSAWETKVLSPWGIQINWESMIHLDHNHVQPEIHDGQSLWVHRKGAQRLLQGQQSVIPGSMGTASYVVQGRANPAALCSCSHGAGRSMSRKQAAQRLSLKQMQRDLQGVCYHSRCGRRLLDEAPRAYKDIRRVMKAQKSLVRIVGVRQPLLNYKGA